jgi:hypothetical protein
MILELPEDIKKKHLMQLKIIIRCDLQAVRGIADPPCCQLYARAKRHRQRLRTAPLSALYAPGLSCKNLILGTGLMTLPARIQGLSPRIYYSQEVHTKQESYVSADPSAPLFQTMPVSCWLP